MYLPPNSEIELKQRAQSIAGLTLGEVSALVGESCPSILKYAKGWTGQLIEKALGAQSFNLDQPDFFNLGIELKTLPINAQGLPQESTYICHASIPAIERDFANSRVWRKMAKMLWVPIESNKEKPISALRIGSPILWSPEGEIKAQLQEDWEELTELMILGHYEALSAHKGKYLQLRPKAANAKTFIQVFNHEGEQISLVPKGFYLRTLLTKKIITANYV
jgi:DNA mismatch repair protein MutH